MSTLQGHNEDENKCSEEEMKTDQNNNPMSMCLKVSFFSSLI